MSSTPRPARMVRQARPARNGIPDATVARLPVYLRALTALAAEGVDTVSSEALAASAGVGSAKLRKDLSHLGSYGTRGVGYDVEFLVYQISRELGLTQDWRVVIVGRRQPRPRPRELRGLRLPGFHGRRTARRGPPPGGRACRRAGRPAPSRTSSASCASARCTSASSPPRPSPRRGSCDRLVEAGRDQRPELRPVRAGRPRGGHGPQGRPVHRAADPRLPRAARVATRLTSIPARAPGDTDGEPLALDDADGAPLALDDTAEALP